MAELVSVMLLALPVAPRPPGMAFALFNLNTVNTVPALPVTVVEPV